MAFNQAPGQLTISPLMFSRYRATCTCSGLNNYVMKIVNKNFVEKHFRLRRPFVEAHLKIGADTVRAIPQRITQVMEISYLDAQSENIIENIISIYHR